MGTSKYELDFRFFSKTSTAVVPLCPPPPLPYNISCKQQLITSPTRPSPGDATFDRAPVKRVVGIPTSMIKLAEGEPQQGGGGLVNASGQLVTIRANDQAFRKLKEVRGRLGREGGRNQLLPALVV